MTDRGVPYPDALVAKANTRSGLEVTIHPIRTDDDDRLVDFHGRLSARSVYRRYFFLHRQLTGEEVEHLTHVDYASRMAFVAESDGQLVAVGRYERVEGTTDAEVAFVVADAFQHLGIGTTLLEHLAAAAIEQGITAFVAEALADNHDMIGMFLDSGFLATVVRQNDTVTIRFPIESSAHYVQACHRRHVGEPVDNHADRV
jgi:GNAT superfamily N-acetyltransferase